MRVSLSLLALALVLDASACTLHEQSSVPVWQHADEAKNSAQPWVSAAHSGSWFTPERSGEGFVLQILPNGTALAVWFTFPPAASTAQQAWIIAEQGQIDGDQLRFNVVYTTRGPRFGPSFDPSAIERIPWGTLSFRFVGCDSAELSYGGPVAWGSGTRTLTRLTAHDELSCNGKQRLTSTGARAALSLRQRSGAWFDPNRDGEGWLVEELPDGRAVMFWFTYDQNGEQMWLGGIAPERGERWVFDHVVRTVGTRFGSAFDPAQVIREPWGRAEFAFNGCDATAVSYQSTAFGQGELAAQRLTRLAGAVCRTTSAAAIDQAQWSVLPAMPLATSEVGYANDGQSAWLIGGFGGPQAVQRYAFATGQWTALPSLPAGRDHALAAVIDGQLWVAGGYSNGGGPQIESGWRYDEAATRWVHEANLPYAVASGAAALDGFVWFGDASGQLIQFDPRTKRRRVIEPTLFDPRDHSQVVAFQGEIWVLGGRNESQPGSESAGVGIYDPASGRWRRGPYMNHARAGFAAAADGERLIVAGGERVTNGLVTQNQVETIAAGDDRWLVLPPLPTAVHGVAGAIHQRSFYALGGSRRAGGVLNSGNVQVLRW